MLENSSIVCVVLTLNSWEYCSGEQAQHTQGNYSLSTEKSYGLTAQHMQD